MLKIVENKDNMKEHLGAITRVTPELNCNLRILINEANEIEELYRNNEEAGQEKAIAFIEKFEKVSFDSLIEDWIPRKGKNYYGDLADQIRDIGDRYLIIKARAEGNEPDYKIKTEELFRELKNIPEEYKLETLLDKEFEDSMLQAR